MRITWKDSSKKDKKFHEEYPEKVKDFKEKVKRRNKTKGKDVNKIG